MSPMKFHYLLQIDYTIVRHNPLLLLSFFLNILKKCFITLKIYMPHIVKQKGAPLQCQKENVEKNTSGL